MSAPGGRDAAGSPADQAARQALLRALRGPVAHRFKKLIPELAAADDLYEAILGNAGMLERAFKTFQGNRAAFAEFLVDARGQPVTHDTVALSCGRTINEVIGMTVRSGMRAYATQHFAGSARIAPASALAAGEGDCAETRVESIAAVAAMFRLRHGRGARAPSADAVRFYESVRDALDYAWQVEFFPIFVEIPLEQFHKLGIGITRLDSLEKLQRLAMLENPDISKAERMIANPTLTREMLDNNALAAAAVSEMTIAEFRFVHDAVTQFDTRKRWDIFANTGVAKLLGKDRRVTQEDIAVIGERLDTMNEHAVRAIIELRIGAKQCLRLLQVATKTLGETLFRGLFGPIPFFGVSPAAAARRRNYEKFIETTLRALVTSVKELAAKFERSTPDFIAECLGIVFDARRKRIEAGFAAVAPAAAPA